MQRAFARTLGIFVHTVGGAENHIHLLMQIPPSKGVLAIKSNSPQWAKERGQRLAWQQGYGVSRDVEKTLRGV
jgi:putative transposase